jgi:ArsR family transcriptional regulator, lead/cadmium/zinc/bismuth-responsive transcriptional repressor
MKNENGCVRVFADKEQIERSKSKVGKASSSVKLLAKALNLAGNEVRLNILFLLYEEGELCVCDLSDILGMKAPAISQHLRKMKDGDVLDFRKDGQTTYYFLTSDYHTLFESFFLMIAKNEVLRKVS